MKMYHKVYFNRTWTKDELKKLKQVWKEYYGPLGLKYKYDKKWNIVQIQVKQEYAPTFVAEWFKFIGPTPTKVTFLEK